MEGSLSRPRPYIWGRGLVRGGLELEAGALVEAEEEVHVVDCGAGAAFEEVVDSGCDEEFVADALQMDEAFVGAGHVLEVGAAVDEVGEVVVVVRLVVEFVEGLYVNVAVEIDGGEDAARESSAHGDEVDRRVERFLHGPESACYLRHMSVGEGLVDLDVVVEPGIVVSGRGCMTLGGSTGDGCDVDGGVEKEVACQRKQGEFDDRGEASGVGHEACAADHGLTVEFGKTVDPFAAIVEAKVGREIDHTYPVGYGVAGEERR